METPYHGYPEPDLATSDIMRKLAYGEWLFVFMQHTFEYLFVDTSDNKRYAVPRDVDGYVSMINYERIKYRAMTAERNVK
jgi:hypothetical protein